MKFRREYIVLMLLIGMLSAYLLFQKKDGTHYELPHINPIEKGAVSELRIRKKDSEIILHKQNGGWLIAPRDYPPDAGKVSRMLEDISNLSLTALASESRNYPLYDLDRDSRVEVEAYGGDGLLLKIQIGKTASSYQHTFVRLGDDHRVYHATGSLKDTFDTTVPLLRDKQVMKIEDEITEIRLSAGEKVMTVMRTTAPVSVDPGLGGEIEDDDLRGWQTADGKPVKAQEINEILTTLSDLSCSGYVEDREKEDFTSPLYTVTLKGMNTYEISLFDKEDHQYVALSSENEYPFYLSEWASKKIMKEFDTLIDTGDQQ